MSVQMADSDLAWVSKVDPHKVYDILVAFAGACPRDLPRSDFVSCWKDDDWREWRFGGDLFAGKIWREMREIPGEGYVPHLRVSCAREYLDQKASAIIEVTEEELLNLLIRVGLRAPW